MRPHRSLNKAITGPRQIRPRDMMSPRPAYFGATWTGRGFKEWLLESRLRCMVTKNLTSFRQHCSNVSSFPYIIVGSQLPKVPLARPFHSRNTAILTVQIFRRRITSFWQSRHLLLATSISLRNLCLIFFAYHRDCKADWEQLRTTTLLFDGLEAHSHVPSTC